jgi:hypothetical protein
MTNLPSEITYSSVVLQDSVRIAFLLAALNDVNLLATEIRNAYLNASPSVLYHVLLIPTYGYDQQLSQTISIIMDTC